MLSVDWDSKKKSSSPTFCCIRLDDDDDEEDDRPLTEEAPDVWLPCSSLLGFTQEPQFVTCLAEQADFLQGGQSSFWVQLFNFLQKSLHVVCNVLGEAAPVAGGELPKHPQRHVPVGAWINGHRHPSMSGEGTAAGEVTTMDRGD